ncbi:DUF3489 domain-containing protein [Siculibacillus lacustris]|uniref:DUF3489 domain-containing protein n=1 Tax=Siculibacillus lacustris TaxID=1549641 RepID=UPI001D185559|nr:DUF3489 domain-containing protein [Siculibacillus lacustris]
MAAIDTAATTTSHDLSPVDCPPPRADRAAEVVRNPDTAPAGKLGVIVERLSVSDGATVADLIAATGWQAHTIRAAISRLRRRGLAIALGADAEGRKAYRLASSEG